MRIGTSPIPKKKPCALISKGSKRPTGPWPRASDRSGRNGLSVGFGEHLLHEHDPDKQAEEARTYPGQHGTHEAPMRHQDDEQEDASAGNRGLKDQVLLGALL